MRYTKRLILLFLLFSTATVAQWRPSPYNYQYKGVKADDVLMIPISTTTDSDIDRAGALRYNPTKDSVQVWNGSTWVSLASGSGLALDSARRSRDTLYFRYTTGGELAVKMDYYTKEESDERYVLSPSGQIRTSWVNPWANGIGNEVPNVANIDTKYMIVNASAGDTTFTVTGGTGTGDFTPPFVAVVYDHTNDRYISFYIPRSSGSTYHTDRPLPALDGDTVKTMHDSYEGQHLTNYGYYSLADLLFFQKKQTTNREYKLYSFYPEDSPASNPFVAIGGAVHGGFIPSTSLAQTLGYITTNIAYHTITRTRYQVQQGTTAGRGVEWTVNLGGKSGYLETFVGTNQTGAGLTGHARVQVILDGVTVFDKAVYGAAQKINVPFKNVTSGTLRIVTDDANPTCISVCRTIWYQSDVDEGTNMYDDGKIVFLGNSWTQFPFIGPVPMQAITNRFKHHISINGGDPSQVINVGRGGMTSAWAKYWFKELVLDNNPKYVYIEFFVNDANSSGSVGNPAITTWNFSSVSPYAAGTDIDGKVSQAQWIENINWMIDTAKAHGIIPIILMNHPTGSILQTQTQSNWGSVFKRAAQYYDIETFFSSSVYADKVVSTPLVTSVNGVIDTIVTKNIKGTTGNTSILLTPVNTNSAINKSVLIKPLSSQAGAANKMFAIENSDGAERFHITADAIAHAYGFDVYPTSNYGYKIGTFLMSMASGIARLTATNSTSISHLRIGDSIPKVQLFAPITLSGYATGSLPSSGVDNGAMAYNTTLGKAVLNNGAGSWRVMALESDMLARYDSNTVKTNFIRNSAAYMGLPQTADILNLGSIRNDGAVVINGSLRLNTGTDAKYNLYYRDSATGVMVGLPPGAFGQHIVAGPGGKPEWATITVPTLASVTGSGNSTTTNIVLTSTGSDPGDLVFTNSTATEYGRVYADNTGLQLGAGTSPVPAKVSILNGGNVGIGLPGPTNKLHVQGSVRFETSIPGNGKVWTDTTGTGVGAWRSSASGDTYVTNGRTGDYTFLSTDQVVYNVDNTAPSPVFTLPTAATAGVGKWYLITSERRNGILPVTFSQTVYLLDGTTTTTQYPGNSILIISDGTNWRELMSVKSPGDIRSITSNSALTEADLGLICNASSGSITISLPPAATVRGRTFFIKRTDNTIANTLNVDPDGSETIDGASSFSTNVQWKSIQITSDGSNWFIIGSNP